MKPTENYFSTACLTLCFFLMVGCVTPPASVRNLETKTSLNTADLSRNLKKFADNHQNIVTAREQTYADAVMETTKLQVKLDRLVAIERLANDTQVVTQYQNFLNELDIEQSNHLVVLNLLSDSQAQLNRGIAKVVAPSSQLDSVAKGLADLANQESLKSRAFQLISFYNDVAGRVDQQQTNASALLNAALNTAKANAAVPNLNTNVNSQLNIQL